MPVEPNTFKSVLNLPPESILELVETVNAGVLLNINLPTAPHDKLTIASSMLSSAVKLFEQLGCDVDITIFNSLWTSAAKYKTNTE